MLKLHVLASGSKGNAAIVENAATGAGVLIDCGICKRDFLERCDEAPDGDALGYITDSGIVTSAAHTALRDVRILALESNHDERMLQSGDYPYVIKRRIASEFGHLSNPQATEELAALITESRAAGLRTPEAVVAMHISQNNNDYDLPRAALEKGLAIAEGNARVLCGYQGRLTSMK